MTAKNAHAEVQSLHGIRSSKIEDVPELKGWKVVRYASSRIDQGGEVTGIVFIGKELVAVSDYQGKVTAWDLSAGRAIWSVQDAGRYLTLGPLGKSVVVTGSGHCVELDAQSGRIIAKRPEWHAERASIDFAPDGKTFFRHDKSNVFEICKTDTGEVIHKCTDHRGGIDGMYTPDSSSIITIGYDKAVRSFITETGQGKILGTAKKRVECISLSWGKSPALVASGGEHSHAQVWSLKDGTLTNDYSASGPVDALSFVEGTSLLAVAGGGRLACYSIDAQTLDPQIDVAIGDGDHHTFSPDGKILVICRSLSQLEVFDVTTGKQRGLGKFKGDLVTAATPGTNKPLTMLWEDQATLHTATESSSVSLVGEAEPSHISAYALSNDGSRVVTTPRDCKFGIYIRNVHDSKLVKGNMYTAEDPLTGAQGSFLARVIKLSPDNTRIAVGYHYGPVRLFDAATLKQLWKSEPKQDGNSVADLAFTPSGNHLVVCRRSAFEVLDSATGKTIQTSIPTGHELISVAVTADGNHVLTTAKDWISISTLKEAKILHTIHCEKIDRNTPLAALNDGRCVVGTSDGQVHLINAVEGKIIASFFNAGADQHKRQPAVPATISPCRDGGFIVTSSNGTVQHYSNLPHTTPK